MNIFIIITVGVILWVAIALIGAWVISHGDGDIG